MKITQLLFILFIFLFCSCKNKECDCIKELTSEKLPIEYKKNVEKAIYDYQGRFYAENDTAFLDSALFILTQVIESNSMLFPAYYYKSFIYYTKGDYYLAVETVDSAIKKAYSNPDLLFLKAKALDHLNRSTEADNILKKTETLYSQWINCYPDSINLIATTIEFIAYYKGKEAALKEIEKYIRKYPNNDLFVGYKELIEDEPEGYDLFRYKYNKAGQFK